MSDSKSSSCCSKQNQASSDMQVIDRDPVCQMQVNPNSPHFVIKDHVRYLFCCEGCKNKFAAHPEAYLKELNAEANRSQSSACCSTETPNSESKVDREFLAIDPVCGMTVKDPQKPHLDYLGHTYYFCNPKCRDKFESHPQQYLKAETTSCCAPQADVSAQQPNSQHQHALETNKRTETPSTQTSCCGGAVQNMAGDIAIDPVCGMSVSTSTDLTTDYKNQSYYFCHLSCLSKFKQDPEPYLIPMDQRVQPEGMDDVTFTCPMDPEIVQQGPGTCPICGMALEPMQPSLDDGPNPELVDFSHRFWMTLPLTLLVFVLAMGSHIHAFISPHIQPWIELVLSLPVVLWAGKPFIERCFISYKTRNLNMWSLIGGGILAAFIYSVVATIFPALIPVEAKTGHGVAVYFEAACMIVSLSLLGQIMELKARAKTADSLKALLRLQPPKAKRVSNGNIEEVDIELIHQGDVLQISSGEHIPLDGIIIDGQTHIDESMMTGEPLPVKKQVNDAVIGGTVNQQGSIRIQTTAVGQNTTLAKMIQTVADAQRSKAPLQRMADVVAKYFVMVVLLISVLTFIAWMVFGNAQFDLALMCAVAVLIIACPCALGLATPMSVMATTGRAAQKGVLFKDAESIETLSQIDTVILDKTGTLTEGKPSIQDIQNLSTTLNQQKIETLIASIEQKSTHPIAKTLSTLVPAQQYVKVAYFEDVSGFGVKAQIDDQWIYIGSEKLINQLNLVVPAHLNATLEQQRQQGHVISFMSTAEEILAIIVIHDAIKPNAREVVQKLRSQGIDVVMASGDHQFNAAMVADQLGIDQVYGNCTPEDKLDLVKRLQQQGKKVAMAGDGINDAPALAQANIGIAMGNGTDIAKQTAQVTLVKGDIRGILDAIDMARKGVKNMKQNLAFSFLYNGLGVPVAAGVFYPILGLLLTPMMAAVAMSLSSLSVVINALRLNKS